VASKTLRIGTKLASTKSQLSRPTFASEAFSALAVSPRSRFQPNRWHPSGRCQAGHSQSAGAWSTPAQDLKRLIPVRSRHAANRGRSFCCPS
jgi:hypothetical protein